MCIGVDGDGINLFKLLMIKNNFFFIKVNHFNHHFPIVLIALMTRVYFSAKKKKFLS